MKAPADTHRQSTAGRRLFLMTFRMVRLIVRTEDGRRGFTWRLAGGVLAPATITHNRIREEMLTVWLKQAQWGNRPCVKQ
jgi:hypothetical protein